MLMFIGLNMTPDNAFLYQEHFFGHHLITLLCHRCVEELSKKRTNGDS